MSLHWEVLSVSLLDQVLEVLGVTFGLCLVWGAYQKHAKTLVFMQVLSQAAPKREPRKGKSGVFFDVFQWIIAVLSYIFAIFDGRIWLCGC